MFNRCGSTVQVTASLARVVGLVPSSVPAGRAVAGSGVAEVIGWAGLGRLWNRLWVADITYVPTTAGFFYLSVVLDAWSRRVVGWSMATHLKTKLVLDALDMALHQRRPEGVIHHSDQGTQYTSIAFGQRCREAEVRPSMGSVGDAYDNALCESFFASLECELIDRISLRTFTHGRREVFDYIEKL